MSNESPQVQLSGEALESVLLKRLQERVSSYFEQLDGSRSVSIQLKSLGGAYARTFRCEVIASGWKKVLYIKQCPVFERLNPAVLEYGTLQLLYQKLPEFDRQCAVAKPLDYFEDLNVYIMESVVGDNLKEILLKKNSRFCTRRSSDMLMEAISGSANWLRSFHGLTVSSHERAFDSEAFLGAIREEIDIRSLRQFRFTRMTMELVEQTLSSLSRLNGILLPCAKWHWDYTPAHVFLDDHRVSVIDITGLNDTPIFEDIGHFLSALVTVNNLPWSPFYDRRRADGILCDRFLEVYCGGEVNDRVALLANVYKLKSLILWFNAQYCHLKKVLPSCLAKAFTDYHLTKVFEPPLLSAIKKIELGMMSVLVSSEGCVE